MLTAVVVVAFVVVLVTVIVVALVAVTTDQGVTGHAFLGSSFRSAVLDVVRLDYVTTARSKGWPRMGAATSKRPASGSPVGPPT